MDAFWTSLHNATGWPYSRRMIRSALVLLVAALAVVEGASAAVPALDLQRADRAAQARADRTVQAWAEWYDPSAADPDNPGAAVYIADYEIDPCERDSRSRAECDVTYMLSDGDLCDTTIKVRTTRRDRLAVTQTRMSCDSDEPT